MSQSMMYTTSDNVLSWVDNSASTVLSTPTTYRISSATVRMPPVGNEPFRFGGRSFFPVLLSPPKSCGCICCGSIARRIAKAIDRRRNVPVSTYRCQTCRTIFHIQATRSVRHWPHQVRMAYAQSQFQTMEAPNHMPSREEAPHDLQDELSVFSDQTPSIDPAIQQQVEQLQAERDRMAGLRRSYANRGDMVDTPVVDMGTLSPEAQGQVQHRYLESEYDEYGALRQTDREPATPSVPNAGIGQTQPRQETLPTPEQAQQARHDVYRYLRGEVPHP